MKRFGREKDKKNIAVPLFIIAIMVLSALGYAIFQGENSNLVKINGFKFAKVQDKYWSTKFQGESYMFYFSPADIKEIPIDSFTLPSFVYMVSNPNANYSQTNLQTIEVIKFELKNSLQSLGKTVSMNFTSQVSCKDSSPSTAVVSIEFGNETKVSANENCIQIMGTDASKLVAARDRFLLKALGVY
jgi:hypothetical protein